MRRGQGRPFKKGKSGNPGGRPKIIGDVRTLAREHTAEALATLVRLAKAAEREETQLAAALALLDRGWGKPTQAVEAAPAEQIPNVVYVPLPAQSPEAWQAEVDAHLAEQARLGIRPEMEAEKFMRKVWPNTKVGRPN